MVEGNENNPDAVLEQQPSEETSQKPTELEHVFVIILLGLLGVGAFLMISMNDGNIFGDKGKGAIETPAAQLYVSPDDTPGRDPNILGQINDDIIGRYFYHTETETPLYYKDGDCNEECLRDWTPFYASKKMEGTPLSTVKNENTGKNQYAWKGKALYTYNLDDTKNVYGDGLNGVWHLARP